MSEETIAVKTETQTAASEQTVTPTGTEGDVEARIAQLEVEKANYKMAFLKEKSKNKPEDLDSETEDERIQRIVDEKWAASKIAQIDSEKESLVQKLIKENKELKLAQINKTNTPPASFGGHTEHVSVQDTSVTPEQITAFKAKGWTDKDIERYKKNLQRYSGR